MVTTIAVHMAAPGVPRKDWDRLTEWVQVTAFRQALQRAAARVPEGRHDRGERRRRQGSVHGQERRSAREQAAGGGRRARAAAASAAPSGGAAEEPGEIEDGLKQADGGSGGGNHAPAARRSWTRDAGYDRASFSSTLGGTSSKVRTTKSGPSKRAVTITGSGDRRAASRTRRTWTRETWTGPISSRVW